MMATGSDKGVSPEGTSWRVNVGSGTSLLGGGGIFFVLSPCHTPKGGPVSSPVSRERGNLSKRKGVGGGEQTGRGGHFPQVLGVK